MEHKERNETIRLKLLEEIADIESFTSSRDLEMLSDDKRACE